MIDTFVTRVSGLLVLALFLGSAETSAQSQRYDNSRWAGGITNTSFDSTCRSFGAHRIGDGSGWELAAEIREQRLQGLLTAKPGNRNKHKYKVSAILAPGNRLERGALFLGPYIAKFDGDIKGDRFEAQWFLSAVGEVDCTGRIFLDMVK